MISPWVELLGVWRMILVLLYLEVSPLPGPGPGVETLLNSCRHRSSSRHLSNIFVCDTGLDIGTLTLDLKNYVIYYYNLHFIDRKMVI